MNKQASAVANWMLIGFLGACWHGYGAGSQEWERLVLQSAEYDGRVPGVETERVICIEI